MKLLPQRKIIKVLESNGFKRVRSRTHITFKKRISDTKVLTTWVPHHKMITIFVVKYIIKQTGKSKEEFY